MFINLNRPQLNKLFFWGRHHREFRENPWKPTYILEEPIRIISQSRDDLSIFLPPRLAHARSFWTNCRVVYSPVFRFR